MDKFIKNCLVLGMLSCPAVFFANPPFWVQLLMTDPPLDPFVKRVAGYVADCLEWCSRDIELDTAPEFGGHAMKPANTNEPAIQKQMLIAA